MLHAFLPVLRNTVLLSLCAALAACGGDKTAEEGATTDASTTKGNKVSADVPNDAGALVVKIGHAAPLTGQQAHIGKDAENGVRMAIDELNSSTPLVINGKNIKFEFDSQDDQSDPRIATTVAQKFADEGVVAVIGHMNSSTAIPASKIYSDNEIVQVSGSATNIKYTNQGYKTAFRTMPNDAQQGSALGNYAVNTLQAKKIAVIHDGTAYGQGLAEEFKKAAIAAGAEIVKEEFTTDKSVDFTAILTNIKASAPDLLFFGGMDPQAAPMVQQMKKLGLSFPLIGGDGIRTPEFIKNAGPAANGMIGSTPGVELSSIASGQEFITRYGKQYGEIQLYAGYTYDAMMSVAEAMRMAQSTNPKVFIQKMGKIAYPGVTGTIAFDSKGDVKGGAVTIYKVQNGKWVAVETVKQTVSNM